MGNRKALILDKLITVILHIRSAIEGCTCLFWGLNKPQINSHWIQLVMLFTIFSMPLRLQVWKLVIGHGAASCCHSSSPSSFPISCHLSLPLPHLPLGSQGRDLALRAKNGSVIALLVVFRNTEEFSLHRSQHIHPCMLFRSLVFCFRWTRFNVW